MQFVVTGFLDTFRFISVLLVFACCMCADRLTSTCSSHLESAEYSGHPPLQGVPPLVPLVDHDFELAGGVGPVLPGQAAVLFVDQLQLSQALVNLPLESLRGKYTKKRMSTKDDEFSAEDFYSSLL